MWFEISRTTWYAGIFIITWVSEKHSSRERISGWQADNMGDSGAWCWGGGGEGGVGEGGGSLKCKTWLFDNGNLQSKWVTLMIFTSVYRLNKWVYIWEHLTWSSFCFLFFFCFFLNATSHLVFSSLFCSSLGQGKGNYWSRKICPSLATIRHRLVLIKKSEPITPLCI